MNLKYSRLCTSGALAGRVGGVRNEERSEEYGRYVI